MAGAGDITILLEAYRDGDRQAFDRLVPLVYDDMRRIARGHLKGRAEGHTLNATGLVHEAWVKLAEASGASWNDRGHFLAVAARAMRQIIIDDVRRHAASKRGGGLRPMTLEEHLVPVDERADWLLAVNDALERLAARNQRLARVVECRFFAGLSEEETARALDVSLRTAQRDWLRARAWLREELRSDHPSADDRLT